MGQQFQEKDKIIYGYEWDMRGKVDCVHDLGKGKYLYSITLDEKLETLTTNDFKHGLQVKSEWKKLGRAEQKDKVEAKYLKAA